MATQTGTDLTRGQNTAAFKNFVNYVNHGKDNGGNAIDQEDIDDEDGELATRIVFKNHGKVALTLVSKGTSRTLANIQADFPEGALCTLDDSGEATPGPDLTIYWVDSCRIQESKTAIRVQVELTDMTGTGLDTWTP